MPYTRVWENKNARRKAYEKAIKTCLIPFIAFFNCRVCMSVRIHLSHSAGWVTLKKVENFSREKEYKICQEIIHSIWEKKNMDYL